MSAASGGRVGEGIGMAGQRIGFIGLGRMGRPMAMRVHEAGLPLTVHDVSAAALEPFRALGVPVASSPRGVADAAEIVFACLPSPAVSLAVALGDDGVAKGNAIEVYVECSTIGPDHVARIVEGLAGTGLSLLDAPVSGGIAGAEEGTLSVAVAGGAVALERARPALSAFAKHVFHVADRPGPAQVAKLINNMLSTTGTIAAFEGLVLGAKAGLTVETLVEFLNVSTGRNDATVNKIPRSILTRAFGGNIATGLKDLGLYIAQAESLGIAPYVAPRVREVFQDAIAAGYDRETMRIIEYLEARAGGDVIVAGGGWEPRTGPDAGAAR